MLPGVASRVVYDASRFAVDDEVLLMIAVIILLLTTIARVDVIFAKRFERLGAPRAGEGPDRGGGVGGGGGGG
jgi:hypothetical protein